MIRVVITFNDGVADIAETWANTYASEPIAQRFLDTMLALYPTASGYLEAWCDVHHRWEDHRKCHQCSDPLCSREADESARTWDVALCEDCQDDRREAAISDGGCGVSQWGPL